MPAAVCSRDWSAARSTATLQTCADQARSLQAPLLPNRAARRAVAPTSLRREARLVEYLAVNTTDLACGARMGTQQGLFESISMTATCVRTP